MTFFRYIGTDIARYDDLFDDTERRTNVLTVDVLISGIELQDRASFAAIRESREPNSSVAQVLPCYQVMHHLAQQSAKPDPAPAGTRRSPICKRLRTYRRVKSQHAVDQYIHSNVMPSRTSDRQFP